MRGIGKTLPGVPPLLSVSELTGQIKTLLEDRFARLRVWGEIGNLSPSRSGIFFTLKDADASLGAVIFNRDRERLEFDLEEGLEVEVEGELDLYVPRGEYKVIARTLRPRGQGALQLAFEQVKERLLKEGLFDRPRKPLPTLPHRIAVVTSRDGAAWHDFARVTHRRNPHLDLYLVHSRVQGDGAALELQSALRLACRWRDPRTQAPFDLLVLTRGGGSLEDLWAFNDEGLARAIAAAPLPVVSAVGHEVDWTIADFVADRRAATPSAAGELVTPEWQHLFRRLRDTATRATRVMRQLLATSHSELTLVRNRLQQFDPRTRLRERRRTLTEWAERLQRATTRQVLLERERWHRDAGRLQRALPQTQVAAARAELTQTRKTLHRSASRHLQRLQVSLAKEVGRLEALNPLAILRRGYSVTYANGRILTTPTGVEPGETLETRLADGSLWSQVIPPPRSEKTSESEPRP